MEVHCLYTYEDSTKKPIKYCLKGEEGEGNENIIEGVNLKVYCTNTWYCPNEILSYYKCMTSLKLKMKNSKIY
jgi:hypothetical protein